MFSDLIRFDGLKSAGPHMYCKFAARNTSVRDLVEYAGSEMQSGGRSRYRAVDMGLDRLIVRCVRRFCRAVQIWRDGYLPGRLDYVGKSKFRNIP